MPLGNPQAWFGAVGVGWTLAAFVHRHRARVEAVLRHPLFRRPLQALFFFAFGRDSWVRGVRDEDWMRSTTGGVIVLGAACLLGFAVLETWASARGGERRRPRP